MRKTNIRFYFEVSTHHRTEGSKELSEEHCRIQEGSLVEIHTLTDVQFNLYFHLIRYKKFISI